MSEGFDPYYSWLAIPPKDQPPTRYRLLGIELFENNFNVIESAADRQMAHLRTFQTGKQSALSQKLLNEVAAARLCLLNPAKKAAYDKQLRAGWRHRSRPAKRSKSKNCRRPWRFLGRCGRSSRGESPGRVTRRSPRVPRPQRPRAPDPGS